MENMERGKETPHLNVRVFLDFVYTPKDAKKWKICNKVENFEHCTVGVQDTDLPVFLKANLGKCKVQITAVVLNVLFGMQQIQ